jgi:5-methylcytosine-specific restriction endonuclease McrA
MRTLLLNANYFPIRVITWERAVKMRFEETADVVAEYSDEVSSPSVTWKIPAVVRERRVARVKHAIRFSRANVYLRDGHRCQYCGKQFDVKRLTYDHVIPRCEGGKTNWENIVTACGGFAGSCNALKGGRDPDNSGFFPLKPPVRPKWLPAAQPRIDRASAPLEWLAFLPA